MYPHHGAGQVQAKEIKEVFGERREYLTIKILHNDMTVMVPTENAALAGLRRVIDEETVEKVLNVLRDDVSDMPKNWNRRFKHNRDKIKTGDIYELAEVVRNLALRENEKGLSSGEKQMYTRAKKILASELMYALDKDENEAEEYLDGLLSRSPNGEDRRRRALTPGQDAVAVALVVAAGRGERLGPPGPRRLSSSPAGRCCGGASRRCAPLTPSRRSWSRCPRASMRPRVASERSGARSARRRSARRWGPPRSTATRCSSTTAPARSSRRG